MEKENDAQSCPALCDPMACSPPCSSVHGIFRARVLEWVAIPFSRGSSQPRDQTHVSCIADGILSHLSHTAQTQVLSKYFIQLTQGLHDCALDQIFYKHTCLSPTPTCFKVSCVREICFYFCLARVLRSIWVTHISHVNTLENISVPERKQIPYNRDLDYLGK